MKRARRSTARAPDRAGAAASDYDRPETIEDAADLVTELGGQGIAVVADHLDPAQVKALAERIGAAHGRIDILVNDIWGAEKLVEWESPIWQHSLEKGLRLLRLAIDTHLITSHHLLPLMIDRPGGLLVEVTDGADDYNGDHYRLCAYYDLAKVAVNRLAYSRGHELASRGSAAVALTPGWLRSEMMLDIYQVTESTWNEALNRTGADGKPVPPDGFALSETPRYVGRAVAALAADGDRARWNQRSVSSGLLAREYGFTDLDGTRPDIWRYMVEVSENGLKAALDSYR